MTACLFSVIWPVVGLSAEEATRLGTVTVTGEIEEEENSYTVETNNVPGIVPDAAALLHSVPGADVNRNGVLTGIAQYRGMYADRVNVKLNGITIPGGGPNGMDTPLSYIPGAQLQGIQVIRGIAPVSSGLETLGGTLHATSIRPGFGTGETVRVARHVEPVRCDSERFVCARCCGRTGESYASNAYRRQP